MATPMTADQLVEALRNEGVRFIEHRSWRTHNRNHRGRWGPVHGVYIHHTAGVSKHMADICYDGYDELPGPVCHGMLAKSAKVYLVGHGRANHAGGIAQNAFDAALNEEPIHPRPDADEPIDGNVHFYGLEIENEGDGTDPFPDDQYDQAVRWAAAHCRFHGWSADSAIGHKEATRRKTDPAFSMTQFRADVAERLRHPASWSLGDPEEDDMTPEQARQLADLTAAVKSLAAAVKRIEEKQSISPWLYKQPGIPDTRDMNQIVRDIDKTVRGIGGTGLTPAQTDALAKKLAAEIAARLAN